MKFGYKFSNLLGTVYRRGDIVFSKDGNSIICPVGNKISMYDLVNNRSITLPIEARFDFTCLALSPNGQLLIAIQDDAELLIINMAFRKVIYRKKLKGNIHKVSFSPCGKYFLLAKNRTVFIYSSPKCDRQVYNPFSLRRVYDSAYDDVTCLDWSHDSRFVCFGAQDMSVHVAKFNSSTEGCSLGGHTDSIVGIFFLHNSYDLCTVTKNSQVNTWTCVVTETKMSSTNSVNLPKNSDEENSADEKEDKLVIKETLSRLSYKRQLKTYLHQHLKKESSPDVTSVCFEKEKTLLVVCFNSGDFLLLDMSDSASVIHSLNMSNKAISSCCLNPSGDWIGLGVESSGELVVWEWQSESHILKQKGHFNSMSVVAYSPDGVYLATGGVDSKLKIWSTDSSFCFVTFSEHSSEITGVVFTQSGKAVVSSSLDGTVRAFDMARYRNFKTMTSPKPAQFSCLTVDSSGELVAAGGQDLHDIFLWSLQTGRLLEVLSGHSGPVVSVKFSGRLGSTTLVSTGWDKALKVWDAIANTTAKETITLCAEGTCLAFRMDGLQVAVGTMDGHITMYNTSTLRQERMVESRSDLVAGRSVSDKITAKSNLQFKFFTCLCYSPDGKYILAAGKSKNVCIYSVDDELLVKKFEVSQNRSLGAMDKIISRRNFTDGGINLALVEQRKNSLNQQQRIPGSSKAASDLSNSTEIQVTDLTYSNTGRSWAACTTEGLLVYSLDNSLIFDPLNLREDITPETVRKELKNKDYSSAVMMALRLNIDSLVVEVLEHVPVNSIQVVIGSLSIIYIELLLKILVGLLETSRHIGFYCLWVNNALVQHGQTLKQRSTGFISHLSGLQKSLSTHEEKLGKICDHNEYTLKYLLCQSALRKTSILCHEEEKFFAEERD